MSNSVRVLVIAPHADDETLGMGATIAKYRARGCQVHVVVMTGHGMQPHPIWKPEQWEIIRAEGAEAMKQLGNPSFEFRELPAACLTEHPVHQINNEVLEVIRQFSPQELYLPYYHDMHRDHTAIAYAGLVSARAYGALGSMIDLVAMYETPTETHLLPATLSPAFVPNHYEDVSDFIDAKLAAWQCYRSQHQVGVTPRHVDALRALATWRGAEIGTSAAEAFLAIRRVRR